MAPLCREHDRKARVVARWRALFRDRAELRFRVATEREGPRERLAELERLVGRLTLALEIATNASPLWGSTATSSGS